MPAKETFLRGKQILITGSAKGLGRELALAFARREAIVIGHYHTSEREARSLLARLRRVNRRSAVYRADLRKEVRAMMRAIHAEYGALDVLVNNVGNFIYKPFDRVTFGEFQDVVETNLYASFLCSALAAERMKRRRRGQIVNFGCAGADRLVVRERTTPYYIAKAGVVMLTKIFAETYEKCGVRVNAVSPGVLWTSVARPKDFRVRRLAKADDILNAVLFLLSPRSSYVNGANIEVAGGWNP